MGKRALIVLKPQNDYFDGGPLATQDAFSIIPIINRMHTQFDVVVFVKDWHPTDHRSFDKQPKHCIAESYGAQFNDGLEIKETDFVIRKGTLTLYDSASAFYNAQDMATPLQSDLKSILDDNKIDDVYLCGFLIETDIFSTAFDCNKLRYNTYLIADASRGLSLEGAEQATKYMEKMLHVNIVNSKTMFADKKKLEISQPLE